MNNPNTSEKTKNIMETLLKILVKFDLLFICKVNTKIGSIFKLIFCLKGIK